MNTQLNVPASTTHDRLEIYKIYSFMLQSICLFSFQSLDEMCSLHHVNWWNLLNQPFTTAPQWLWGCPYGCPIWSLWLCHCDTIHWDKAVSQRLSMSLYLYHAPCCHLICTFDMYCMHTPEIIYMKRNVCDDRKNSVLNTSAHCLDL